MLDGMDFYVSFGDGGGAIGFSDVFDARFDFRLSFKIHAAETDAAVGRRRQDGHVDPVTAMEAHAGKFRRTIERLLVKHKQIKQNVAWIGKNLGTNSKCIYRVKVATLATSLIFNE